MRDRGRTPQTTHNEHAATGNTCEQHEAARTASRAANRTDQDIAASTTATHANHRAAEAGGEEEEGSGEASPDSEYERQGGDRKST